MSDDYLWDGSGAPGPDDRDVVKLEQMLGQLRAPLPPAPALPRAHSGPTHLTDRTRKAYATTRFLAPALAMAAAIVLMIASTYRAANVPASSTSWAVERMDGRPQVEARPIADKGRIAVGQTLTTDADSRASMEVSSIGLVTVDRNTRVRLVETRKGRHELALASGTLHAFITAPPGEFIVNTPSSTATDLGCVYTLHVDEDGAGLLSVRAGWVAFEFKGRESFVPANASARTDPDLGPGTPRYDDADQEFRDALDRFDTSRDDTTREQALGFVLMHAREKDAMTIWHLIPRTSGRARAEVTTRLDQLAPRPINVSDDAVQSLDRAALDLWWDSLGLRDATWWRKWKVNGALPPPRP